MSNRLPILAADIRRAHIAAQNAAMLAAQKAIEAGQALIEAKSLVSHGGWLPFLADAGVPERTAQRYMTLARSGLKYDIISDLGGIAAALEFLSLRKRGAAALNEAALELERGNGPDDPAAAFAALPHLEAAIAAADRMLSLFPGRLEGAPSEPGAAP